METIISPNNQWIKQIVKLRQKKNRDQTGLFVVEGVRSVRDAMLAGIERAVCFICIERLSSSRTHTITAQGESLHWFFLEVDESLYKKVSNTEHGQGIVAILPKPQVDEEALLQGSGGWLVFLDAVQDPGNLGTIIRTAAASGCKGVLLGKGCADPYSEKAARSSVGSILRIPVYQNISSSFLQTLKHERNLSFIGTALAGGKDYKSVSFGTEGLFIFGNEGNGISQDILSLCDQTIYIPLKGGVESLNVSVAASVILFHYLQ